MSGRAAILGLGSRGAKWAETCLSAGWDVRGFDPDDRAGKKITGGALWQREARISGAVAGADWVICCLPERLELMRTVIQRAQAAASEHSVIAVVSDAYDVDAVQGCAIRPSQVVRLTEGEAGAISLDVSGLNDANIRSRVTETLAIFSAASAIRPSEIKDEVPERRKA